MLRFDRSTDSKLVFFDNGKLSVRIYFAELEEPFAKNGLNSCFSWRPGKTEAELLSIYPQLIRADLMPVWEYATRAAAEEIIFAETGVRLLFDENLSVLSAHWAASALGVDVIDARAAGLAGKTDQEMRRYAIETGRILVTLDADFGNLIRFSPTGTPDVIWLGASITVPSIR